VEGHQGVGTVGPLDIDGADGAWRRRVEEDLPGILDHVLQDGVPAIPAADGHDDDLVLLVVADEREWQPVGFHPAAEFRRHHLDGHRLTFELPGHAVQESPPLLAHGLAHLLAHPMSPSCGGPPLSSPAPAAYLAAGRRPRGDKAGSRATGVRHPEWSPPASWGLSG